MDRLTLSLIMMHFRNTIKYSTALIALSACAAVLGSTRSAGAGDVLEIGKVDFSYSKVSGIGLEPGVCRRDPSDVIKVGGNHYVWYTKVSKGAMLYPSGYNGDIWYARSGDEGKTWKEMGCAVSRGKDGDFDSFSVFTPNILVVKGKYHLYYTAVGDGFTNTGYSAKGMTKNPG